MLKKAIQLSIKVVFEFDDDEAAAMYVCEELEMDECPDWLVNLVQETRELVEEDGFAGEAQRDSWIETLTERYEEEAA